MLVHLDLDEIPLPDVMLINTAQKGFQSCISAKWSYAEISRLIRPAPALQQRQHSLFQCTRQRLQTQRDLHSNSASSASSPREKVKREATPAVVVEKFKQSLRFPAATVDIKELVEGYIPKGNIVLHGYLGARVDLSKSLCFVPLLSKDLGYSIQIVSSSRPSNREQHIAHEKIKAYGFHTPVAVTGILRKRDPTSAKDSGNVKMIKTLELELQEVQALNEFPKDIIFTADTVFPAEQRHLQLRQDKSLRDAIAFRAKAAAVCRDVLANDFGFIEVETPLLFKSTPEGAREFIVPTRRRGFAYALPQSPQQFKQTLMASGIARYYQVARCFRDEDLRADRQPEFTQLDVEMSFASGEDVMHCVEAVITILWKRLLGISLPSPFQRMTYHEAMSQYGSDKPNLRLDMPISRIEYLLPVDLISKISPLNQPAVEVMLLKLSAAGSSPEQTRRYIGHFMELPEATAFNENKAGGPGLFIYDSARPLQGLQPLGFEAAEEVERLFSPEDGDLLILQARENVAVSGGSTPLGNLRLALHRHAVEQGILPAAKGFKPLWVTDFPLFSPSSDSEPGQGGSAGLAATHHPFTSPKSEDDVDLLLTDPTKAIGDHYDLVVNGVELGGGSRRIHNVEMQKFVMSETLKMSDEKLAEFEHLLEVLRAGCPPHAGIALGFDRLVALMLGKDSVRDVIAFPKSGKGEDLLVKSPGAMSEEVLETYHLKLRETL